MREEYWFDEGCFISEWSNAETDPACSIARARVLPGQTTQWHRLIGVVERYTILSGSGWVEVGELQGHQVNASDVVVIPAGTRQRISNHGKEDLVFLAICTPRFTKECYCSD